MISSLSSCNFSWKVSVEIETRFNIFLYRDDFLSLEIPNIYSSCLCVLKICSIFSANKPLSSIKSAPVRSLPIIISEGLLKVMAGRFAGLMFPVTELIALKKTSKLSFSSPKPTLNFL